MEEAEVDYVAIGGVAAIAHGAQRITRDLDIVIPQDAENAKRLLSALAGLQAEVCTPPRNRFPLEAGADPELLLAYDRFFDTSAGGLDVRHSPPGHRRTRGSVRMPPERSCPTASRSPLPLAPTWRR